MDVNDFKILLIDVMCDHKNVKKSGIKCANAKYNRDQRLES